MTTARQRVRLELTQEIKDVARRQLAEHGAADLSLRAVAREVGMVSSAIYRYFPSRDELLTALIIDAFNSVGAAAEEAEQDAPREKLLARWFALAKATRTWALAHPQEYALIFGTPVPGYSAPQDTVDPGVRIPLRMTAILIDACADQKVDQDRSKGSRIPSATRRDLAALRTTVGAGILSDAQMAAGLMAWTQLIGCISFELFGQLKGAITDFDAYFDYQMGEVAKALNLA